ncbi:GNAT family N-acetyltransferase [Burkholderia cepacia]|uniref:GNAT family N-acetyltransferase n=1 Tax=Burkholderia cepacia TaxID=292 RepID=UPI0018C8CA4B|nr:GNAT family N-acetyltransferase [Burkholderia cepacia]
MRNTELTIGLLPSKFSECAWALIDSAFKQDPTLGWCLFSQNAGFDGRRGKYLRSYLEYHHKASLPALGVWAKGTLVAASYFTPGSSVENPTMLEGLGRRIDIDCGKQSLSRIDLLRGAVESRPQFSSCNRIEFIGVSPTQQGNGVGSALLEATLLHLCEVDPSRNVFLETGEPRNLPFYLRHGFELKNRIDFSGLIQYLLLKVTACGSPS